MPKEGQNKHRTCINIVLIAAFLGRSFPLDTPKMFSLTGAHFSSSARGGRGALGLLRKDEKGLSLPKEFLFLVAHLTW